MTNTLQMSSFLNTVKVILGNFQESSYMLWLHGSFPVSEI